MLTTELIQPIKASRLYEGVMESLRELISKGHYQPGDCLPPESELCEKFQVSRTSIRAALRTLGAQGLVTTRNGGGTCVSKGSPESLGQILSTVLFHDFNDLEQIYEARRVLESWTAFFAASRITDEEINDLDRLIAQQEREVRGGESGIESDFLFHLRIGKAARNEIVTRLLYSMITLVFKGLDPANRPASDLLDSVEQHRGIVQVLRRRDPVTAMERMWNHIKGGRESNFPESNFSELISGVKHAESVIGVKTSRRRH